MRLSANARLIAALAAAFALCAAPALQAQSGGLAVKGGLSYGNVSNNGALPGNVDHRTGFAIGVSATTGGAIGFGVEGMYAQRGITSANAADTRKLDYIDVPVYVRVALPLGSVAPFVYAGPQAMYEINCGTENGTCGGSGREKFTYAGVIGAGLKISGVSFEGRYVYGLKDLNMNTVSSSSNYRTRSFMLLAGIGF